LNASANEISEFTVDVLRIEAIKILIFLLVEQKGISCRKGRARVERATPAESFFHSCTWSAGADESPPGLDFLYPNELY
jgi:hypothetical protein